MEVKESKRINAEDLYELKSVVDPQVNGIGQECLYVLTSICKETDKYYSNIFHKNLNTLETSQWTFGKDRNHSPRWSPNGEPPGEITWAPRGNHVGPQGKSRGHHGEITSA